MPLGFSLSLLEPSLGDAKFCESSVIDVGRFFGRRAKFKVSRAIPHAIFRLLWMERNKTVFIGLETSLERLKDKWLRTLFFSGEESFCFLLEIIDLEDSLFLCCFCGMLY